VDGNDYAFYNEGGDDEGDIIIHIQVDDDNAVRIQVDPSVTSIPDRAFKRCRSLMGITIPNSVTSIGSQAFYYCESLETIDLENTSVQSIGAKAFFYCELLREIQLPTLISSIGDMAFWHCKALISIVLPGSITFGRRCLLGLSCSYNCGATKWYNVHSSSDLSKLQISYEHSDPCFSSVT
jgi:hypothetical protein